MIRHFWCAFLGSFRFTVWRDDKTLVQECHSCGYRYLEKSRPPSRETQELIERLHIKMRAAESEETIGQRIQSVICEIEQRYGAEPAFPATIALLTAFQELRRLEIVEQTLLGGKP